MIVLREVARPLESASLVSHDLAIISAGRNMIVLTPTTPADDFQHASLFQFQRI